MDLTLLLPLTAGLLASGLAIYWVARPLFSSVPPPPPVMDDRLAGLLARKEATLTAIRELDFDRRTGKLSDEDFARYDARLRRQAIALQQQIEKIAPLAVGSAEAEIQATINAAINAEIDAQVDPELDALIEAEIARRRKTPLPNGTPTLENA